MMDYLRKMYAYIKPGVDRLTFLIYPALAYLVTAVTRYLVPPLCGEFFRRLYIYNYPFEIPEPGTFHYHSTYVVGLAESTEYGYQLGAANQEYFAALLAALGGVAYKLASWFTTNSTRETDGALLQASPTPITTHFNYFSDQRNNTQPPSPVQSKPVKLKQD